MTTEERIYLGTSFVVMDTGELVCRSCLTACADNETALTHDCMVEA